MQLFYVPDLTGENIQLPDDEARHCVRVLRKVPGDAIQVTDGRGGYWNASVTETTKRECWVQLVDRLKDPMPRSYKLTMAIAPSKNTDRFEWFLEKATEIGIDRVVPILTIRTERPRLKTERMERILVSAMKQSGRAVMPVLDDLRPFEEVLQEFGSEHSSQRFIATCFGDNRPHLADAYEKGRNVVIFIGPEGDFTDDEVQQAVDAGFGKVSLGPARLRLETAGVTACHIVNLVNETA